MITTNLQRIPRELKERAQWLTWRLIRRGNELAKVPFQITGEEAKSNDSATWNIFEAVAAHVDAETHPGFVFTETDPFCGIDLDGCRKPETGEVAEWAREIIKGLNSYAEVSPSGTGVKVFVRAVMPDGAGKKKLVSQDPMSPDKKPGIEIYDRKRYFAVTGAKLKGVPETIEERQEQLNSLLKRYWPVTSPSAPNQPRASSDIIERARKYVAKMAPGVSGNRGHDATFSAACVLVLGFGLDEHDALALMQEYNSRCDPPWSEKELLHKVKDAGKQSGERNYLRDAPLDQWPSMSLPAYAKQMIAPVEVTVTTLEQAARAYADKLTQGKEVLIDTGIVDLDQAVGGGFAAGEMVIMAARPSHGKSAVALQCVHHWTRKGLPCAFVSEEMSAMALGKRAVMTITDIPEARWAKEIDSVRGDIAGHFESRAQCHIVENCRSTDNLRSRIEKLVAEQGVKCVVVDYAQLLQAKGNGRYESVTNVSIALRQLTSSTGVLLLALCQLSREIESREVFRPKMSDLKESGQFEQDGDAIIFNVWPWMVDQSRDKAEYEFYIAKVRNRGIARPVVTCRFEPERQTIHNLAPQWLDDPFGGTVEKPNESYGIH